MIVRRAAGSDVESLLPLVRGYRVFYKREPDAQGERAFIEARLREQSSVIYIAEVDGSAAGFAQLFRTYSTVRLAAVWILEDLFVDPAHRKSGVARALLQKAVEHAKDDGAAGMFLETAKDNAAAQRVYEAASWRRETHFLKYNAPLG